MSLPPEWEIRHSKSRGGRVFYYNKLTKQSRWDRPFPDIDDDEYPEIDESESDVIATKSDVMATKSVDSSVVGNVITTKKREQHPSSSPPKTDRKKRRTGSTKISQEKRHQSSSSLSGGENGSVEGKDVKRKEMSFLRLKTATLGDLNKFLESASRSSSSGGIGSGGQRNVIRKAETTGTCVLLPARSTTTTGLELLSRASITETAVNEGQMCGEERTQLPDSTTSLLSIGERRDVTTSQHDVIRDTPPSSCNPFLRTEDSKETTSSFPSSHCPHRKPGNHLADKGEETRHLGNSTNVLSPDSNTGIERSVDNLSGVAEQNRGSRLLNGIDRAEFASYDEPQHRKRTNTDHRTEGGTRDSSNRKRGKDREVSSQNKKSKLEEVVTKIVSGYVKKRGKNPAVRKKCKSEPHKKALSTKFRIPKKSGVPDTITAGEAPSLSPLPHSSRSLSTLPSPLPHSSRSLFNNSSLTTPTLHSADDSSCKDGEDDNNDDDHVTRCAVEEMEIDVVVAEITQFRNNSCDVTDVSNLSDSSLFSAADDTSNTGVITDYMVLDTNVLIHDLTFVKELMVFGEKKGGCVVVIPWLVLQELDGLKSSESVKTAARTAISFLLEVKQSGSSGVVFECDSGHRTELPDDRILLCMEDLLQTGTSDEEISVSLISGDKNLCLKSEVKGFPAFSIKEVRNVIEGEIFGDELVLRQKKAKLLGYSTDGNSPPPASRHRGARQTGLSTILQPLAKHTNQQSSNVTFSTKPITSTQLASANLNLRRDECLSLNENLNTTESNSSGALKKKTRGRVSPPSLTSLLSRSTPVTGTPIDQKLADFTGEKISEEVSAITNNNVERCDKSILQVLDEMAGSMTIFRQQIVNFVDTKLSESGNGVLSELCQLQTFLSLLVPDVAKLLESCHALCQVPMTQQQLKQNYSLVGDVVSAMHVYSVHHLHYAPNITAHELYTWLDTGSNHVTHVAATHRHFSDLLHEITEVVTNLMDRKVFL